MKRKLFTILFASIFVLIAITGCKSAKTEDKKESEIEKAYQYSKTIENIKLEINIPKEWQYEELVLNEKEDNSYKYALKLYRDDANRYAIMNYYNDQFSVCGTGRTTKKIILNNGKEATIGYYDNNSIWDDISFYELEPHIAFINNGLENDEALEVLEFVKTININ